MQTKINKLKNSKIEILFELSWEEFSPYLDKAASELSKGLEYKGFRPGKVPPELLEKEIGQEKILAEGAEMAIKAEYPKIVQQKQLELIGSPQVEILKIAPKNPFSFKVKVDVLPEIPLPDYKKIASEVERKKVEVSEKEVQETLDWLRKSRAKFKDLEREAKKGDFLEIEYKSPQIEGGKTYQDRFFLGKGHFLSGFEENLEGMRKGQEKEFTLTFPKDYYKKELASKDVNFKVKIKKIQEVKVPEINDEFARTLGNFENLENLKESIKEGLAKEKEIAEKERRRSEILEKIANLTDFEVPEILVSLEKERMFNDLKQRVESGLKVPFEEYLKETKKSEAEIKNSFLEMAEKRVKNFLVLREIGKRERVEVKEEEIKAAINEFLKRYPDVETAEKEIDLNQLKEYYRGVIYNEKVLQFLESLR
jgi:trigger factor